MANRTSRHDNRPKHNNAILFYSHVRLEAKRKALTNLSSRSQEEGHVTIDVTNEAENENSEPQLTENMVDVTGIEPVTPCLQSRCSPS